jgi:hypothetical protein
MYCALESSRKWKFNANNIRIPDLAQIRLSHYRVAEDAFGVEYASPRAGAAQPGDNANLG